MFIYPWAVQFKSLGWTGFATMFGFIVVARRRAGLRAGRREPSNGRAEREPSRSTCIEPAAAIGLRDDALDALLAWARKYSLFKYPFVTACCGMEFMAVASPRYDIARFGAEAPRFSPRQSDCSGSSARSRQRQAPVLKRIYEQMVEPKWVLAFGTCASLRRLLRQLHDASPGIDKIIPCDVYIPGCPPRPEAVLDGLMLLQDKIARGDRAPAIVKPRTRSARRSDARACVQLAQERATAASARREHEPERSSSSSKQQFGDAILETHSQFGDDTAVVDAGALARGRRFLRDDPQCAMNMFVDLTAVDYPGPRRRASRSCCTCTRSSTRPPPAPQGARRRRATATTPRSTRVTDLWAGAELDRARELRHVRHQLQRPPGSAPHPDVPGVRGAPAPQGLPGRQDPAARAVPRGHDIEKLAPFGADEGMPFGRQTHDARTCQRRPRRRRATRDRGES